MKEALVVGATIAQAETVIRWLKFELTEDGGFYHNRSIIRRAARSDEMRCLCLGRIILAFAVFTKGLRYSAIDILEVRPRYRGRGYGGALAVHIIGLLLANGADEIHVECMPRESESFWRRLGFIDNDASLSSWGNPKLILRSWPNNSFRPNPLPGSA